MKKELEEVLYQEELIWFQKSRENWIVSGDRNTKFYHAATVVKRTQKRVAGLRNIDDDLITDKGTMKKMMTDYFKDLFSKDNSCDISVAIRGRFPDLSAKSKNEISRPVLDDEIKCAIFDMAPLKAPGPDGLHAMFYQRMWPVVGNSIVKMVKDFFATGILPDNLNDTLITLIPKVDNPDRVNQFRPISLCNVCYKIITKTLTNRFKKAMKELVGPHQSSFVPGRHITDNIITYQEVLNNMRNSRGGKGTMVIKIDLEKAYDRLSWDFIRNTLEEAGFGSEWTRIIMACIESSRLSIKWEGEISDYFRPGRGIRQGDSISPFLFVLCMERLSHMIEEAVQEGAWKGIKMSRRGPTVSHLFFADDMVLFSEADEGQVEVVKNVLDRFSRCSG